jgi:hypothetical protein
VKVVERGRVEVTLVLAGCWGVVAGWGRAVRLWARPGGPLHRPVRGRR